MLTVDDLKKIPTGGGGDLAGKCVRWCSGPNGKVKEGVVIYDGPKCFGYHSSVTFRAAMPEHFQPHPRGGQSMWKYNHRADHFASGGLTVLMHRVGKSGKMLTPHTFSPFRSQVQVIEPEDYIRGLTEGVDQRAAVATISYSDVTKGKVFAKTNARGGRVFRVVLGTGTRRYSRTVHYLALKVKGDELVAHNTSCSPNGRGACNRSSLAAWATEDVTTTPEGERALAHPTAVEALSS